MNLKLRENYLMKNQINYIKIQMVKWLFNKIFLKILKMKENNLMIKLLI